MVSLSREAKGASLYKESKQDVSIAILFREIMSNLFPKTKTLSTS